jgi:polyribonucleotide nucleotidyltransferase
MVELEAKEITEKELYKAVTFAQKEIQKLLCFFQKVAATLGVKKRLLSAPKKIMNKS